MRWSVPQRFSAEWWIWLAGGAFAFGVCTFIVLYWRGIFTDPIPLLLVALAGSAIGDLLMAASFEAIAPSKVTLGPGERVNRSDDILELATVVSGFNDSAEGRVRARGEIWGARCHDGTPLSLTAGVKVKIVDRDGLTLLIRSASARA
jgi:membrane protein implicated in regulation of membrane protease activity